VFDGMPQSDCRSTSAPSLFALKREAAAAAAGWRGRPEVWQQGRAGVTLCLGRLRRRVRQTGERDLRDHDGACGLAPSRPQERMTDSG
jgi:hypothetical protein